ALIRLPSYPPLGSRGGSAAISVVFMRLRRPVFTMGLLPDFTSSSSIFSSDNHVVRIALDAIRRASFLALCAVRACIAHRDARSCMPGSPAATSSAAQRTAGCRLLAHPFRQGAGLSKTPARQRQPDLPPVAWWRELVSPSDSPARSFPARRRAAPRRN